MACALSRLSRHDRKTASVIATLAKGEPLLYEQLLELVIRVSDHMLKAHETLRQKARRTMGGEVLELMRDRAEHLEREAREQGIKIGIEQVPSRASRSTSSKVSTTWLESSPNEVSKKQSFRTRWPPLGQTRAGFDNVFCDSLNRTPARCK